MDAPDWRDLPALSTLRAFEATARLGGYAAAARSLNVTPAAIAQQVRKLESEVGAALVRREGRGLALTPAGTALSRPLQDAFGQIARGVAEARHTERTRGIRATTTTFIVDAVILPKLADFWRDHPGIQVSFVPGTCASPIDFDGFDLGIRVGVPQDWPNFHCEPLLECETIFVAAPELAASARPQDLPWVISGIRQPDRDILRKAGLDVGGLDIRDMGEPSLDIEAAKRGIGAIMATEVIVRQELREGSLVRLDLSAPDRVVYHVILPKGPVRPPVRTFVDWLRESLTEG